MCPTVAHSYKQPDIVLGTEAHLDGNYKNSDIFPPPYTALRNGRNDRGGGVFTAYRDDMNVTEIDNIEVM